MTGWTAKNAGLLGAIITASLPLVAQAHTVHASHHQRTASPGHHVVSHRQFAGRSYRFGHLLHYASFGRQHVAGISCVPFARSESGIALSGNAATWWDEAEGRYARGNAPEAGSVLNFRANASMHLGHVAVVRDVVNTRQIEIDQANWWGPGGGRGRVSRDVAVIDVSPHNDWTAVRVALGNSGSFGSVYPTYGFIYGRAEGSDPAPRVTLAEATGDAALNPAPRDLRPRGQRTQLAEVHPVIAGEQPAEEVAEAPANAPAGPISLDAPDRNLR